MCTVQYRKSTPSNFCWNFLQEFHKYVLMVFYVLSRFLPLLICMKIISSRLHCTECTAQKKEKYWNNKCEYVVAWILQRQSMVFGFLKNLLHLTGLKKCLILVFKHSLIRGVLIQSCSAGAKKITNYVFCHPQFSGVIQNIENCCAIRAKFWKFDFWLYKIDYFDNNPHSQTGVKMAQWFSIFLITPLSCGWQNT